jgi:hypothetical protein
MHPHCEVCENFRPNEALRAGQRLVEVPFDVRNVTLCVAHARIAERSGVTSFDDLRELYGKGRRSFVPRRGPDTARTLGERDPSPGRRASDLGG